MLHSSIKTVDTYPWFFWPALAQRAIGGIQAGGGRRLLKGGEQKTGDRRRKLQEERLVGLGRQTSDSILPLLDSGILKWTLMAFSFLPSFLFIFF